MNLLLLEENNFTSSSTACVTGRQLEHVENILKLSPGETITLGRINGNIGTGKVVSTDANKLILEDIFLDRPPPPSLPVTLILALPRPQMLKRTLQTIATLGVERLFLIQTSKVEKSFWQSPSATPQAMREQLILGLEQAVATQLPKIECYKRFIPFVEDCLDSVSHNSTKLIAHPNSQQYCPSLKTTEKATLVIGPEGGFIDNEVKQFESRGFNKVTLGKRILKVESAVPIMIAKLYNN